MKTSNKLILIGSLILTLSWISVLLFSKSYVTVSQHEFKVGTGNKAEKLLRNEIITRPLTIQDYQSCIIDTSFSGIKLIADDNLLDDYYLHEDRSIELWLQDDTNISTKLSAQIVLGVKQCTKLNLFIQDRASFETPDVIQMDSLILKMDDYASGEIEINSNYISIRADENTDLEIKGMSEKLNINLDENASVNLSELSTNIIGINLEDRSRLKIKSGGNIYGVMEDNAVLETDQNIDESNIQILDNAKIKRSDMRNQ